MSSKCSEVTAPVDSDHDIPGYTLPHECSLLLFVFLYWQMYCIVVLEIQYTFSNVARKGSIVAENAFAIQPITHVANEFEKITNISKSLMVAT